MKGKWKSNVQAPTYPAQNTKQDRKTNTENGIQYKTSHVTRKPVFGICDQVIRKPASSATETS